MITVVGSSNTDFTVRVRELPFVGETVLGSDFFTSGGGKGANQAACIARLGGKVNLIANIGSDVFGDQRIKDLESFGVNTKYVKRDRQHPSGVAFILVDKKGKNLIAVSPGSNSFLKLNDIVKAAESIKKSDVVLIQLEIPTEAVRAAVYLAKRFDKAVILNPAPARPLNKDILSKIDILVPNELEASELGGPRLLLNRGVGCVIITLGKKGVLLINKKGSRPFKARQVKVVDTTCAGDAFCGAFALGLDKGRPIEKAIEFANITAALTCSKLGAQCSLPTLKQVTHTFKEG
ncbi:MAG: ribokinase [Candidatus Omnitrophota bacterium]